MAEEASRLSRKLGTLEARVSALAARGDDATMTRDLQTLDSARQSLDDLGRILIGWSAEFDGHHGPSATALGRARQARLASLSTRDDDGQDGAEGSVELF